MTDDACLARQTWILLHEVEGPINLGAVCRAMANTGFQRLRYSGSLVGDEVMARKFALSAVDLLHAAEREDSMEGLCSDLDVVFGFTPRPIRDDGRGLSLDGFHEVFAAEWAAGKRIGLCFGNEARGLRNEDLAWCRYRVALPSSSAYTSLNLAQAVLVVLWEVRRRFLGISPAVLGRDPDLANADQREHLLANIHGFLETIGFLNPQNPEQLWAEIAEMFRARDWTTRELTLLHAVFGKARSRYLASLRRQGPHDPDEGTTIES